MIFIRIKAYHLSPFELRILKLSTADLQWNFFLLRSIKSCSYGEIKILEFLINKNFSIVE